MLWAPLPGSHGLSVLFLPPGAAVPWPPHLLLCSFGEPKESKYQTAATIYSCLFSCKLAWLIATPLIFVNQVFVRLVRTVVLFWNFTYPVSDKMRKDDCLSDMSFVNLAIAMILWLVFKCHGCRNVSTTFISMAPYLLMGNTFSTLTIALGGTRGQTSVSGAQQCTLSLGTGKHSHGSYV